MTSTQIPNHDARKKLLVFVAQRPTLDPRVDWIASSASTEFEVIVHGLRNIAGIEDSPRGRNGYRIEAHDRISRTSKLVLFFLRLLSVMPIQDRFVVYFFGALLSPGVLLIGIPWGCVRAIRRALRAMAPLRDKLERKLPIVGLPIRIGRRIIRYFEKIGRTFLRAILRITRTQKLLELISMVGGHLAPTTAAFWGAVKGDPIKPDVIHCCDLDTLLVGVLARRKYGSNLIYDAHEYWPYTDPSWPPHVISFYRYLERLLIHQTDHAVTVSPLLAAAMQRDYELKCIHSIPNAAPWTKFAAAIPSGIITKLAAGRTSFLFQGGIAPERGLEELLVTWAKVDASKAALFIRAPNSIHKDALFRQALTSRLLDRSLYFLESVTEDCLIEGAREADVGLIPYKNTLINHRLACPNKLSQYMHAGLMVISSDIPYVAQIIRESGAGLSYESGSSDSLLNAINTTIRDRALLAECKKNALDYAQKTFNWGKFYPVLRQLYGPTSHGGDPQREPGADRGEINQSEATLQKRKKTVLVLYFTRGVYPLRSTIRSHLYCWEKYSEHDIVYVNVALGFPNWLIKRLHIDVIIFHTMFLSMRWTPATFKRNASKCIFLKSLHCTKIIVPQDEFLHTEILNDFCNEFGITHILTNSKEKDWGYIYDRIDRNRVMLMTVLTGYLDPESLVTIETLKARRNGSRTLDIGYRAWKAEYWLGEHGMHKTRIAAAFKSAADRAGLKSDVSLEEKDVIPGDAWFDYLLRCKATIGVEGGASVLDKDGRIKDSVASFLKLHPDATFEEARAHCFKDEDGRLDLACISPRHLEACATETFQFLVEGYYNGILIPWRHYIPILKDYSNIRSALAIFADPVRMQEMTSVTYNEIVGSGKWTYPVFVKHIEDTIINVSPPVRNLATSITRYAAQFGLRVLDKLGWLFIRTEHWCVRHGLKTEIGRWFYARLARLKGTY